MWLVGKINFSAKVPSKRPLKLAISEGIFYLCVKNLQKDRKTIYTTDVIVEEHEFAQNKDNGAGADSSETQKTDKDGFMEAPEGEIPFD